MGRTGKAGPMKFTFPEGPNWLNGGSLSQSKQYAKLRGVRVPIADAWPQIGSTTENYKETHLF